MQIIRAADFNRIAWDNGAGITYDIALSAPDQPFWRLSLAEMPIDAPFSKFDGLSRILTVVKGNGLTLVSPEGALQALPEMPVNFSGEQVITGKLIDGPVQNFNLVFDGSHFTASVKLVTQTGKLSFAPCPLNAIYLLSGTARLANKTLQAGDAALSRDKTSAITLHQDARFLWVTLHG